MIAQIDKYSLVGAVTAPPSKSMAHRMLVLAALSRGVCKVTNLAYSEDVLAMLDCISALGAVCKINGSTAEIDGRGFLSNVDSTLNCRESGNTLRFLIPIALTLDRKIRFNGSKRLMERPQGVYEKICAENGYLYERGDCSVSVCGTLKSGVYELDGSVSSQFITGMILALLSCEGESEIRIIPPFESRSYVDLTLRAVELFGGHARFTDDFTIAVRGGSLTPRDVAVEGDYSNAAFLDAFNCIGGNVKVLGLSDDSAQGDRVYKKHFAELMKGCPTIDISDCPDLGPVLMAVAALNHGCRLIGTRRLAIKESDRGAAMREELDKFSCHITCLEDEIIVPKTALKVPSLPLNGHNDHRIVMSMALLASVTGGMIEGCEAVRKTYPDFFDVIKSLGAKVEIR